LEKKKKKRDEWKKLGHPLGAGAPPKTNPGTQRKAQEKKKGPAKKSYNSKPHQTGKKKRGEKGYCPPPCKVLEETTPGGGGNGSKKELGKKQNTLRKNLSRKRKTQGTLGEKKCTPNPRARDGVLLSIKKKGIKTFQPLTMKKKKNAKPPKTQKKPPEKSTRGKTPPSHKGSLFGGRKKNPPLYRSKGKKNRQRSDERAKKKPTPKSRKKKISGEKSSR